MRRPDLVKSNGGGANAILVRGQRIAEHRRARLRRRPERRVVHAVRLADGTWVANLHAQVHDEAGAQADVARSAAAVLGWAGDAPAVLGGDLNTRRPAVPGLRLVAGHGVDHVAARGLGRLRAAGAPGARRAQRPCGRPRRRSGRTTAVPALCEAWPASRP